MGSFCITVSSQSILGLNSSTNKYQYNPINNHQQPPQILQIYSSGSNSFLVKSEKNRSFCITKASIVKGTRMSTTIEKLGVKIERNPSESRLSELGVRQWPKWGCTPSKFPWTYEAKETCYLLQGKVKVYPEGSNEAVEIGAGDLVVFPKGMACTWDVSEAVDKHYNFELQCGLALQPCPPNVKNEDTSCPNKACEYDEQP